MTTLPVGRIGARFLATVPVLPSSDVARDVAWYGKMAGFEVLFSDDRYAAIHRDGAWLHLQWHADTAEDPLLGGSVVRLFVKDVRRVFEEFVRRGTVDRSALRAATAWGTDEFGFKDPNGNALFIVQDRDAGVGTA